MSIPVILDAVVIDSTNNTIRVIEAGVTTDVTITPGTYYIRGDGSGVDDLVYAVGAAISAATGANTYTGAIVFDTDPDAPAAVVTITRDSGTNTWGVQWAATQTTFDPAWLGFIEANEADADVASRSSTVTPTACWVGDGIADLDPERDANAYVFVTNDGTVAAGLIGGPFYGSVIGLEMIPGKRMWAELNTADPAAALSTWWERAIAGGYFELHQVELASTTVTTTETPSNMTAWGQVAWHLHEDSVTRLPASKLNRATSLWSTSMRMRKRVP